MDLDQFEKNAKEAFQAFTENLKTLNEDPEYRNNGERVIRQLFPGISVRRPILRLILDLTGVDEYPDREVHLLLDYNQETGEVVRAVYVYRDGEHRTEYDIWQMGETEALAKFAIQQATEL